jgi:hypothetical protein
MLKWQRKRSVEGETESVLFSVHIILFLDHLCGLVVRVSGYRSEVPGSILGAIRFSEK